MQYEVNALGPLRVVHALRDRLAPGAKVAIITSKMGSLTETTKGGMVRALSSSAASVRSLESCNACTALAGAMPCHIPVLLAPAPHLLPPAGSPPLAWLQYGYRMSKAAVNMAGRILAYDLAQQGVALVLLHPGAVSGALVALDAHRAAFHLLLRRERV